LNSTNEKNETVSIGKIVGVHGLNGTCKVYPYADSRDVFVRGGEIFVLPVAEATLKAFEVDWSKPHNRLVLVSLKGVNDRNQAEKLVGSEIVIDRAGLPNLDPGTYYWHDLIGMTVYSKEDVFLGRLEAVMTTGSNDVYVVKRPEGGPNDEILVPALNSVVIDIDLENRRMRVDLPKGL
jgi:16S rRNA processing protein RimM